MVATGGVGSMERIQVPRRRNGTLLLALMLAVASGSVAPAQTPPLPATPAPMTEREAALEARVRQLEAMMQQMAARMGQGPSATAPRAAQGTSGTAAGRPTAGGDASAGTDTGHAPGMSAGANAATAPIGPGNPPSFGPDGFPVPGAGRAPLPAAANYPNSTGPRVGPGQSSPPNPPPSARFNQPPVFRDFPLMGKFGQGFELTGRFNALDTSKTVFTAGLADPNLWTNNLYMTDIGFNWYLNQNIKIVFDWNHAVFGNPVQYNATSQQKTSDVFLMRFQLYF